MTENRKTLVCVGDGGVGKTCLLISYCKNEFPTEYIPTVFESYSIDVPIKGVSYTIELQDTAGQEEFGEIRKLSYQKCDCLMLCFKLSEKSSFENVKNLWKPEIDQYAPRSPIILIGTQLDVVENDPSKRKVSREEALTMQRDIGAEEYADFSTKKLTMFFKFLKFL